jgi:hypothetical protein
MGAESIPGGDTIRAATVVARGADTGNAVVKIHLRE